VLACWIFYKKLKNFFIKKKRVLITQTKPKAKAKCLVLIITSRKLCLFQKIPIPIPIPTRRFVAHAKRPGKPWKNIRVTGLVPNLGLKVS
jgi:hypothetical protein